MHNELIQKKDEMLILTTNILHLCHFRHDKNFSLKIGFLIFCVYLSLILSKNSEKCNEPILRNQWHR